MVWELWGWWGVGGSGHRFECFSGLIGDCWWLGLFLSTYVVVGYGLGTFRPDRRVG